MFISCVGIRLLFVIFLIGFNLICLSSFFRTFFVRLSGEVGFQLPANYGHLPTLIGNLDSIDNFLKMMSRTSEFSWCYTSPVLSYSLPRLLDPFFITLTSILFKFVIRQFLPSFSPHFFSNCKVSTPSFIPSGTWHLR